MSAALGSRPEPASRCSTWGRLRRAAIDRISDRDVRWRSLGGLFLAGGVLVLVSLVLPADAGSRKLPIALLALSAILTGVVLVTAAHRLPPGDRWLSSVLGFGTVLITLGVIFNRSSASPYALLYVWVAFDGFFFLSRTAAYANLVWLAGNYAAGLLLSPATGESGAARWFMMMGTVGVVAVLADVLRSRSDESIARLSDAARTDALTALLNRRGFEERMSEELERSRRTRRPFSLVVGDLDHFKLLNDRFGHQIGDEALRRFGELLGETKRGVDAAARIGGEEFALVLPDTDEHGAYVLAERVRRRLRETLTAYGSFMSVSLGVASYPRHGDTTEELMRCADQAMYLAKHLGRDRSVIYSAEVSASLRPDGDGAAGAIEQLPSVLILAETLDLRDSGTAMHSQTVGRYAQATAAALGLSPERVERIRLAGLLHDIGKLGVPDFILRKPGALDDAEWAEMRKHPELGARILAGANLDDLSGWVLAHHERPDGRGYPAGLSDAEIPLEAKILAVADAFEAMTSERVYRRALPLEEAREELRRCAGTQFDAAIVETFLASLAVETPAGPDAAIAAALS